MASRLPSTSVALLLLVTSCAPSQAGPELPRPPAPVAEPPATTTTVAGTTTSTTLDETELCPSAFCLVYRIRDEATWSDGSPVTGGDFVATARLARDPRFEGFDSGYELIDQITVLDDKTVRVEMNRRYGGWPGLFEHVLPMAWDGTGPPPSSTGRFEVSEALAGDCVTLRAVPDWWAATDPVSGAEPGDVVEVQLLFVDGLEAMLEGLESAAYQVVIDRPDAATASRLGANESIAFHLSPGPFWEHIDFRTDHPLLGEEWARRAIAMAIDRESILDATIRLIDPGATALGNTLWMQGSPWYEDHYDIPHDPVAAEQILIDNGCTREEGGIYTCLGAPMTFSWATTDDDPARRIAVEQAAEDLAAIGVGIESRFVPPSTFVTRDFLFAEPDVWQVASFSWRAAGDPAQGLDTHRCDGALNVNRACVAEMEALFDEAEVTLDRQSRAALLNQADAAYLAELPLIPLYQKPELMAWSADLTGPLPNPGRSSDLWNVNAWSGRQSVVVALGDVPDISLSGMSDPLTRNIWSALVLGAHAWTPEGELVPVLVESVSIVEGDS